MPEVIYIAKAQLETLSALRNVSPSIVSHGGNYLIAQNTSKTLFLYADNFGLPSCYLYDVVLLISAAKSLGDVLVVPDEKGLTLQADKAKIYIAFSDSRLNAITLPAELPARTGIMAEFDMKKDQYTQIINLSSNLGIEMVKFNFSESGVSVDSTESRKDNRSKSNKFSVQLNETSYPEFSVNLSVELLKSLNKTDYKVDINEKSFRFSSEGRSYYMAKF